MRTTLIAAALCAALAAPAYAADPPCRTNFGGLYTFPHGGVKPGNIAYAGLAYFQFNDDHTTEVDAWLNTAKGPLYVAPIPVWHWMDDCLLSITSDQSMVGYVSDDGQTIGIFTPSGEITSGTATRKTNGH